MGKTQRMTYYIHRRVYRIFPIGARFYKFDYLHYEREAGEPPPLEHV